MKNIYIRFLNPCEELEGDVSLFSDEEVKERCFITVKYGNESEALEAYANTPCFYSTLLEEAANVDTFINEAILKYRANDLNWFEKNFI